MSQRDDPDIPYPTEKRLRAIAERWGLDLTQSEIEDYRYLVEDALDEIATLDNLGWERFDFVADTGLRSGYRPGTDANSHNAWITKCNVSGNAEGPLTGLTVGLKDCIAVAGIEMTCGSSVLEGFVPNVDATVVRRLLADGARLRGKTNMDSFLFGATSLFQDFGGVTTNPHSENHLAGGSTSGAAAVADDDCDVVIGTDQNGSTRAPSSWCGCVGMKPTFGLVPYTGIFSSEASLDHVGIISESVAENATVLESIAGTDTKGGVRFDPRQPASVEVDNYTDALSGATDGVTIGILEEGFGRPASDPEVDDLVMERLESLEAHGIKTERVSVSAHNASIPQMNAVVSLAAQSGIGADGVTPGLGGWKWTQFVDALNRARQSRANQFSPVVKTILLIAGHLSAESGHHYYATAKNLMLAAEREYTAYLESVDVLALPTTPMTAFEKDDDVGRIDRVQRDADVMINTTPFNHTGHPAMSVPCGTIYSLPVGLQLVGSKFGEAKLYQVASLIEDVTDAIA